MTSTDSPGYGTFTEHKGFMVDQRVYIKFPAAGVSPKKDRVVYPVGSPAIIHSIERYPRISGNGGASVSITLAIGEIMTRISDHDAILHHYISTEEIDPLPPEPKMRQYRIQLKAVNPLSAMVVIHALSRDLAVERALEIARRSDLSFWQNAPDAKDIALSSSTRIA